MRQACQYAIVQFRPFVETAEFANVGVLLLCPEKRFFDFRLMKRYRRVTQFFHQLDRKVYLEAMGWFREELERVTGMVKREALDGRRRTADAEMAQRIFAEVVRTREGLLRFDAPRVVLADDPARKLDDLYEYYIERNFVTKAYQERVLENTVKRWLNKEQLPYVADRVGNEDYAVRFPFVYRQAEQAISVIKPLHLAHDDSNKILDHGGVWVEKVRRLRRHRTLPARILFALNAPDIAAERRFRAFKEIEGDLVELGVTVLSAGNQEQIVEFATGK